jgi:hypothetical protein
MADDQAKPRLEVVGETAAPHANSIFDDLDQLRKASKLIVQRKTVLVNVSVDKPGNNCFFRAHPEWYLDESTVIKDKDTGVYYFVQPSMRTHPKLAPRTRQVTLAAIAIWPADTVQIWPVPIGVDFKAWKSARAAYELSRRGQWVQIAWDAEKSDYVIEVAEGIDHEPHWPECKTSFNDLLKLGFDGKILDNEDHEYVRQLRGLSD